MKVKFQILDEPNKNNRIYPKEIMQKAIDKFNREFIAEERGFLVKEQPGEAIVRLTDVVGKITYMGIEGAYAVAEIEKIPNINGSEQIWPLFENGQLHAVASGMGTLSAYMDGTIQCHKALDDYELICLFLTPDPA